MGEKKFFQQIQHKDYTFPVDLQCLSLKFSSTNL